MAVIAPTLRQSTRPNWAEISVSALRHNFRILQQHVGRGVTICAVVKCDAYGHYAPGCALELEREGATWFGVTSTDEAVALREAGVRGRILVMTGSWRDEEEDVLRYSLTPAVTRIEECIALAEAAGHAHYDEPIRVHLKIDTGMSRLGIPMAELDSFAERLKEFPQIEVEGVFSHLASAEVLDADDARLQSVRFGLALRMLGTRGIHPRLRHLANSSGAILRPETWHTMVRPGIALYGYELPASHRDGSAVNDVPKLPLKPVLSWKTRIISVRDVPGGQALGYNGIYVTPAPARIAVIPAGYGDGFSRQLSVASASETSTSTAGGAPARNTTPAVLLRGQRAPIVGRISMDLTIIDVTNFSGIEIGDEVVLIGRSGDQRISAWDHARWSGTVVYETLCNLSERVPRRMVE